MDIVLLIIAICYPFIFKYLEQYFVQKGKNAAQKEDMRDIQYETKKGENIATKEDIEEISFISSSHTAILSIRSFTPVNLYMYYKLYIDKFLQLSLIVHVKKNVIHAISSMNVFY